MIRLKDILKENKEKKDAGMVSGVADIVSKVEDKENRKDIANQMLTKFDLEDVDYDKDSFLKLSGVNEAPTKGQIFGGKLKIDGKPVPVEVELLGANDKTKTFIVKVIHIDKQYYSKLPKDGILNIPARIFRVPGGGWHRIKTPSVFKEEELDEVGDNDTNLNFILRRYDSESAFGKKKIGVAVARNPKATRKDIYNALRDMGHEDTVDARKDLRMWEGNLCEDCWKGYKAVGVKKKGDKMVPNCVPQNEDTAPLPMLQKPTKPKKAKISKPRFGGTKPAQTDRDRIKRATVRLDVSKKNLTVARTPRQKTQVQRRIQKQQQRLTKLKQSIAAKKAKG